MKNIIFISLLFIFSYTLFYLIGGFLFDSDVEPNSLMSAVIIGGVNYLALFIYFILACIATAVLFFSFKSKNT